MNRVHADHDASMKTFGHSSNRFASLRQTSEKLHRLCSRTTLITALNVLVLVLRNAVGSIAGAWISSAFCALGNIFSGRRYVDQSRNELMVANSVWAAITFCSVVFGSCVVGMTPFRFLTAPDSRPTIWFCAKKLGRTTIFYFGAAVGIIFSFNCLVAYLISIAPNLFKYKVECYVNTLTLIGYIAAIARATNQIFLLETCHGRDRLEQKQKSRGPSLTPDMRVIQRLSSRTLLRIARPTFWQAYVKTMPVTFPPFLACIFVHVLSQQRIVDRGNVALTSFVIASIVFKLAVQELAEHYIFKKNVRSARVMCVLVGIPTVLIDTQTRIILLGTNSVRTAAMGAAGMALIEISLRSGKAALLMWEIRHRKSMLNVVAEVFEPKNTNSIVPRSPGASRPSISSHMNRFEVWRRQVMTFHLAEINADMYAEYISIGCSAAILLFCGNHPQYSLLRQAGTANTTPREILAWRVNQLKMLALQVGVEVVVDYVSIVLEVTIGIEFDQAKKLGSFLAAMFVVAAVINSTVSICIYLS